MGDTFQMKQNDTRPSLYVNLAQDGSVVDLTGAAVKFHMGTVIDTAAVITDATRGSVRYDWLAADTATSGSYRAEFQVTFSDGGIETFPNDGHLIINIYSELA